MMRKEEPHTYIKPKKRLGRIRRGVKLGIIKPIRGEKNASKVEGEAGGQR